MPIKAVILILIVMASGAVPCVAEIDGPSFAQRLRHYYDNSKAPVDESALAANRDTKYLLIKGLLGEWIPGYFLDAQKTIEKLTDTKGEKDPAKKRVFRINGDSRLGIDAYSAGILKQVRDVIAASPPETNFVALGHSMGALATWTLMMRFPELLRRMDAAIYLQGPFGGSPLATFIHENRPVSQITPMLSNHLMYAFDAALLFPYRLKLFRPALEALLPLRAIRHVHRTLRGHPQEDPSLREKTLYLTTSQEAPTGWREFFPPTNLVASRCIRGLAALGVTKSDGMVPLNRQAPRAFAERTQHAEGFSHNDFTLTPRGGNALGRALLSTETGR